MAGIIAEAPDPGPAASRGPHWCVVLAAGGSRRLGRPKQFVNLGGLALVVLACHRALATRPAGVVVVAGAHASRVRALLAGLPVAVVRNTDWRTGLASSLRVGLRRVPASVPSVLVTTVDQWCVTPRDLRRLLRARAPAAAQYDGIVGVPARLPRAWRARVDALRGDRGARALLDVAGVRRVPMPAASRDLDVRADLATVRRRPGPSRRPGTPARST